MKLFYVEIEPKTLIYGMNSQQMNNLIRNRTQIVGELSSDTKNFI